MRRHGDMPTSTFAVIGTASTRRHEHANLGDARSLAGVGDIFEIALARGSGVAVVADRFWTAKQARDLVKIDWDLSGIEHPDSSQLWAKYKELSRTPGNVAVKRGDDKAIDAVPAGNRIVAEYEFPYLAHTPMEPLNATVRFDGDAAEAACHTS